MTALSVWDSGCRKVTLQKKLCVFISIFVGCSIPVEKHFLIHEAGTVPHVVSVCLSVPKTVTTFQNLSIQNRFQMRIVIATSGTVGLAEWIIDGTHVLFNLHRFNCATKVILKTFTFSHLLTSLWLTRT